MAARSTPTIRSVKSPARSGCHVIPDMVQDRKAIFGGSATHHNQLEAVLAVN
jgi:hypothetical protein